MSGLLTYSAERTNESQSIITIDDAIDMLEMGDMHDENAALESLFTTLETGEMAIASLESLVAYKEDLITSDATVSKQTVDALNITLESICLILDYPVDHVTMSTETITEDDTNLVLTTGLEKEVKLLALAKKAISKVTDGIKQIISKILPTIINKLDSLDKVHKVMLKEATIVADTVSEEVPMDSKKNAGILKSLAIFMANNNDTELNSTAVTNVLDMMETIASSTTNDSFIKVKDEVLKALFAMDGISQDKDDTADRIKTIGAFYKGIVGLEKKYTGIKTIKVDIPDEKTIPVGKSTEIYNFIPFSIHGDTALYLKVTSGTFVNMYFKGEVGDAVDDVGLRDTPILTHIVNIKHTVKIDTSKFTIAAMPTKDILSDTKIDGIISNIKDMVVKNKSSAKGESKVLDDYATTFLDKNERKLPLAFREFFILLAYEVAIADDTRVVRTALNAHKTLVSLLSYMTKSVAAQKAA